ncbi:fimbrial protein [Serratia sp. CY70267]|uniref:fimbrial protein n=1 Tax=Serratia TaxID=613 RepID=UPI0018D9B079|nr:fimbrial protein [Serratia marcescens]EMB2735935.1 fimbrial protein [Serratia marcescens]MBH2626702.1 fimbrial protein [Serratia marcescens]ULF51760.1 fimbrial protein [Serratia marcescens]WPJ24276.1 fimbrial protein [Serratia marcescens]
MKYIPGLAALACMGLLVSGAAQAIKVNFTGNLVAAPDCVLNTDKDISVDFAEVVGTKVDGKAYKKMPIPYTVSCSGGSPGSGQLKVMLGYTTVPWGDYSSIQAQPILKFANFGLRIIEGDADKTYVPNTKVVVADQNNPPKFYAVPIGKENAGLPVGDFTASATMTAMYE